MTCPDCYGTSVRLVPVPWTRGAAWVKAPCTCHGGFVPGAVDWDLVFASPAGTG